MYRLMALAASIGISVALTTAPAFANQCPKLVAKINAIAGNRFDATAAAARAKAAEADQLHKAGKHDESEKVAKDALTSLGEKI